jgi:hypothetical protein
MKRQLLEKIIKGVQKDGYFEVSLAVLETVLRQGDRRHPQTKKEVFSWAEEQNIQHEYKESEDGKVVRFFTE